MGSVGDAYDNAMTESFFSTLEAELLSCRRLASQEEARIARFSYIEGCTTRRGYTQAWAAGRPSRYVRNRAPPHRPPACKLVTRTGQPHLGE